MLKTSVGSVGRGMREPLGSAERGRTSGMDIQIVPGLLSSRDGSFRATLRLGIVVPESPACQLVMYFEIGHLRH